MLQGDCNKVVKSYAKWSIENDLFLRGGASRSLRLGVKITYHWTESHQDRGVGAWKLLITERRGIKIVELGHENYLSTERRGIKIVELGHENYLSTERIVIKIVELGHANYLSTERIVIIVELGHANYLSTERIGIKIVEVRSENYLLLNGEASRSL